MNNDLITDKQYNCIKKALIPKYHIDLDDLKKLTKKEASNIIKVNVIRQCPLLQWYVWKKVGEDKLYINTCEKADNIMYKEFLNKILIEPKIFLKKRMAEEFYGTKLERKSPVTWYFYELNNN